ncbi:MAG TPA: carboxylesterase family protein [Candidatus Sulfotelmatobacter sp.]
MRSGPRKRRLGLTVLPSRSRGRHYAHCADRENEPRQTSRCLCKRRLFLQGYSVRRFDGRPKALPASFDTKPWTGVRDALDIGPPAPQSREWPGASAELQEFLGDMVGPGQMGEDCLVLNLWTPSLHRPNKRPVMVFLHGAYVIGSSGIPLYDGTNLAARHDVVVVGLNHRLNFTGYLYLGGIGGEKYADSGNLGLLDIVFALQWVRANVRSFGGDPTNVTIFGESDGGSQVTALLAMPSAKGLFQKAIVESGSDLRVSSREEADAAARKFLAQLHVAPDRVDDLRTIPMDRFIAAHYSMGESFFSFGPVVDGRSLPRQPFDPDAPAISAGVPMLIGTNADEARTLLGLRDPALFSLNEADMRTKVKAYLEVTDDSKLDSLIAAYRKNRPNATPSDIFFAITTDLLWRMGAVTQGERKAAQHSASAYMYIFEWPTPVRGGKLKAMHGVELPFVFDNVDKVPRWIGQGAGLQPLADKVSGAWVEFARSGNPNHMGLPHWPTYETSTRATMIFNDDCKVMNDPGKDERLAKASMPQT